jgi:hypothetical protein
LTALGRELSVRINCANMTIRYLETCVRDPPDSRRRSGW